MTTTTKSKKSALTVNQKISSTLFPFAQLQATVASLKDDVSAKIPAEIKTLAHQVPVKGLWSNLQGRSVSQLATLAVAAKLSTIVVWVIMTCSPGLDLLGNLGVLLFGLIAIYKLTRTTATNLGAMAAPIIKPSTGR